ncbi:MAG: hypothetical protein LC131_14345, partial [Anaerolineae bacterium]|nr:hypothetical protein [Anaerolineae bacterium]
MKRQFDPLFSPVANAGRQMGDRLSTLGDRATSCLWVWKTAMIFGTPNKNVYSRLSHHDAILTPNCMINPGRKIHLDPANFSRAFHHQPLRLAGRNVRKR